jgi:hypothetical protein
VNASISRWKIPAVIALAIGSYVAGTFHPREWRSDPGNGRAGGAATNGGSGEGNGADTQPAAKTERTGSSRKPGGPVLGTPFAKGQARSWFLQSAREGWGDDMQGFLSLFQVCGTLDEAAARELLAELKEMNQQYRDGNPEVRAAIEDDDILEQGLMVTLFRLSQLDPVGTIEFLHAAGEMNDKDDLFKMAFGNLAKQDPGKLAAELQKLEGGDLREAMEGAMEVLRKKDTEAAMALLEKFPQPEMDRERRRLVEHLAGQDPQEAIKMATRFVNAGREVDVFGAVVEMWARKDKAAALAWAADYQGPGAIQAKQVMLQHMAVDDPRKAAELMSGMAGAATMANAASHVAARYAEQDLAAAQAWVSGLAQGPARSAAEQSLVAVWVRSDPLQAAEWIDKMPVGQPRDDSAMHLIRAIRKRYPQEAFDWAGSLQNPELRQKMEEDVFLDWRQQDPDAAEAAWTGRHGKQ